MFRTEGREAEATNKLMGETISGTRNLQQYNVDMWVRVEPTTQIVLRRGYDILTLPPHSVLRSVSPLGPIIL